MPSYNRINYDLRPAKSIERKMINESLRKLSAFQSIESYRYIGFGSLYFSDFSLFHKELNLTDMNSIEHTSSPKEQTRIDFNRPFNCINMYYDESSNVLPQFHWDDTCTITWLDYDYDLNKEILDDIRIVTNKSCSGSIIIVTVKADPPSFQDEEGELNLDQALPNFYTRFKERIGEDKLPSDVTYRNLRGWDFAKVCRRIINNEILEALQARNVARPSTQKMSYKQLYNFHYSDGAKMITVGGIIYNQGQSDKVTSCGFQNLNFIKEDEEPFKIEIPMLTYKELKHLNSQFPQSDLSNLESIGIPKKDIERYHSIYRYFPNFAEIGN
ncbi:O-methyltransferase [Paenibacillus humicus]|uniref:O-methyltransferase n=1 Tax=Paenibacillus humicus TaxID=412861 RepID=UPI000FDC68F9|nr:O-methyltransferase [Paenibacillus humicus]